MCVASEVWSRWRDSLGVCVRRGQPVKAARHDATPPGPCPAHRPSRPEARCPANVLTVPIDFAATSGTPSAGRPWPGLRARSAGTWRFRRDSARRGEFVRPAAADPPDTSTGWKATEGAGSSRPPSLIRGRDSAALRDETGPLALRHGISSILARDPPRPGRANAPAATPDPEPRRPRYGGAPRQVPRTGDALVSRLRGDARRPRKHLNFALAARSRGRSRHRRRAPTGASRDLPRS